MLSSLYFFICLVTDNPHLVSTIEQQKLKFLVAVNEPKKEMEGGASDRRSGNSRRIKSEAKGGDGLLASELEGQGAEEGEGEGMNKQTVRESMQQMELMHTGGSDESESFTSLTSFRKVG